jgi:hypothetical protein
VRVDISVWVLAWFVVYTCFHYWSHDDRYSVRGWYLRRSVTHIILFAVEVAQAVSS